MYPRVKMPRRKRDGRGHMAEIFISYRRDDARAEAGRLHDRLAARFGHAQVFMDVADIAPGEDFEQRLHTTLGRCVAVVVVIGRDWLGRDPVTGGTRMADPGDFVHIEVRAALARGIPVFPVLVGGATMPARAEIPDALTPLLTRQAIELRDARFSDDVAPLIEALGAVVRLQPGRRLARRPVLIGLCAALVLGASYVGYRSLGPAALQLRSEPAPMTSAAVSAMLVRHDFFDARRNAAGRGPVVRLEARAIGDAVVVVDRSTHLMWQQAARRQPPGVRRHHSDDRCAEQGGIRRLRRLALADAR